MSNEVGRIVSKMTLQLAAVLIALTALLGAANAQDTDGDGVPDARDNRI